MTLLDFKVFGSSNGFYNWCCPVLQKNSEIGTCYAFLVINKACINLHKFNNITVVNNGNIAANNNQNLLSINST